MTAPEPDWTDDGVAGWDAEPWEVHADPTSTVNPPVVVLDGRITSPAGARRLARALLAAADYAEGRS